MTALLVLAILFLFFKGRKTWLPFKQLLNVNNTSSFCSSVCVTLADQGTQEPAEDGTSCLQAPRPSGWHREQTYIGEGSVRNCL